jgi:hypothetical protein
MMMIREEEHGSWSGEPGTPSNKEKNSIPRGRRGKECAPQPGWFKAVVQVRHLATLSSKQK